MSPEVKVGWKANHVTDMQRSVPDTMMAAGTGRPWCGCSQRPTALVRSGESPVCMLRHFVMSLTLCDPMDYSLQAPLSMGLSRQEYWSGLPFSSPQNLPDPGIEPMSANVPCIVGRIFTYWATWEALIIPRGPGNIGRLNKGLIFCLSRCIPGDQGDVLWPPWRPQQGEA